MENIKNIIEMLENLAAEHRREAQKLKKEGKAIAGEYFEGKADGLKNAASLIRIGTNNEIPFEI